MSDPATPDVDVVDNIVDNEQPPELPTTADLNPSSSSSRMDLRVGGKYRLGKKIGSGSFGESSRLLMASADVAQVIFISALISFPARKSPSSSSRSRQNTLSSNMRARSTRPLREASAFHLSGGSAPSATTMPWSLISSALRSKISSIFATANSPSRPSSYWPISS